MSRSRNGTEQPPVDIPGGQQPIAIIGLACRLPGAHGPDALWKLLEDGVDATSEVPRSRFDVDAFYSSTPATAGKIASRRGGFIADVDLFDAEFFGLTPREAERMDPQQRLLLMTAWEALEDAGQPPERYVGSRTGVFIGQMNADYWDLQYCNGVADLDLYSFTGGYQRSLASGRLAYAFDLRGPNMVVDTACSSSLTAIHLACQSLRCGESTMALAGGVNLALAPNEGIIYSQVQMLAPDGRCKFGDENADGFVRSEGVGVIVLKPLSKALADGDPVRAVILGSAVSNDGRSKANLTAPSQVGQTLAMRWAYQDAGVTPADVDYIEAHSTGTRIDLVEMAAFGEVIGEGRPKDGPCLVGSVKTNIGHAEGAAGVAGVIKAVLCLQNGQVPQNLHFHPPHSKIPWDGLPLVIPTGMRSLPNQGRPAIAAVNGQGISATNVHIVLGQADPTWADDRQAYGTDRPHLLTLSARTPRALEDIVRSYVAYLEPGGAGRAYELRDICYSAAVRRTHHESRLAVIGTSHDDLAKSLRDHLDGTVHPGLATANGTSERQPSWGALDTPRLSAQAAGLLRGVDDVSALLASVGLRYTQGQLVDWAEVCEPGARCVPLPTYSWQLASYCLGPTGEVPIYGAVVISDSEVETVCS